MDTCWHDCYGYKNQNAIRTTTEVSAPVPTRNLFENVRPPRSVLHGSNRNRVGFSVRNRSISWKFVNNKRGNALALRRYGCCWTTLPRFEFPPIIVQKENLARLRARMISCVSGTPTQLQYSTAMAGSCGHHHGAKSLQTRRISYTLPT